MSLNTRNAPVLPYQLRRINAGSSIDVPYQSIDDDLNKVTLATDGLRWRVDNLTDSKIIKDWQTVSGSPPAQKGTITIPASDNEMTREWRDRELRQVVLEFTDTNGNKRQRLYHYEVNAVFEGSS